HEPCGVLPSHTLLLSLPKSTWISRCWIPSSPSLICRESCAARAAPIPSLAAMDLARHHRRKPHTQA
uniref:Uncharacterized protein n=1 Tax=Aegilops tauschii subsp. strangulata TaxID=200361 RepID=A0A452XF02_AEGTS